MLIYRDLYFLHWFSKQYTGNTYLTSSRNNVPLAYFHKHTFQLKAPPLPPPPHGPVQTVSLGFPPTPELTDTGRLRMKVSIFTPVCLFMGGPDPSPQADLPSIQTQPPGRPSGDDI